VATRSIQCPPPAVRARLLLAQWEAGVADMRVPDQFALVLRRFEPRPFMTEAENHVHRQKFAEVATVPLSAEPEDKAEV
jgi:hypothetical protein